MTLPGVVTRHDIAPQVHVYHCDRPGGVAERLNAPVLKTGIGRKLDRGFESHPRRSLALSLTGARTGV